MKTGVERWIKVGQMPTGRGFEKVKRYVRDVEARLIDDLGGVKTITSQQEILIRGTIKALGVCCLVELYINREGPIVKHLLKQGIVELQPCLGKSYLAFLNTIRQNVVALGLGRREAEKILDLGRYIELKDRAAKVKAAGKAGKRVQHGRVNRRTDAEKDEKSPDSGTKEEEIAPPRASGRDVPGDEVKP